MGGKGVNAITVIPMALRPFTRNSESRRWLAWLEALLPLCNIHATDFYQPIFPLPTVTLDEIYTTYVRSHCSLPGIEVA